MSRVLILQILFGFAWPEKSCTGSRHVAS